MTPHSSDKVKYNTGYLGWLLAYSRNWFLGPIEPADEFIEWLQMTGYLVVWTIGVITSPITFPLLTLYVMISSKRDMIKQHGKDKLKLEINHE